jgi:hypothetical protein
MKHENDLDAGGRTISPPFVALKASGFSNADG